MRTIVSILVCLLIASSAMANTVESSTMTFQGSLTADGSGGYVGTIGAAADINVYAKEGSIVDADGSSSIHGQAVGSDHDAWPSWDPDVPDAYDEDTEQHDYYALNLNGNEWELWYVNSAGSLTQASYNDGNTVYDYAPMGGTVDWTEGYATEAGQNWEQQWSWGYENVALEHAGFDITVVETSPGSGVYDVTMTPAVPEPATMSLLGLGGIALLRRRRNRK